MNVGYFLEYGGLTVRKWDVDIEYSIRETSRNQGALLEELSLFLNPSEYPMPTRKNVFSIILPLNLQLHTIPHHTTPHHTTPYLTSPHRITHKNNDKNKEERKVEKPTHEREFIYLRRKASICITLINQRA
jgi:hypothetical protein